MLVSAVASEQPAYFFFRHTATSPMMPLNTPAEAEGSGTARAFSEVPSEKLALIMSFPQSGHHDACIAKSLGSIPRTLHGTVTW